MQPKGVTCLVDVVSFPSAWLSGDLGSGIRIASFYSRIFTFEFAFTCPTCHLLTFFGERSQVCLDVLLHPVPLLLSAPVSPCHSSSWTFQHLELHHFCNILPLSKTCRSLDLLSLWLPTRLLDIVVLIAGCMGESFEELFTHGGI